MVCYYRFHKESTDWLIYRQTKIVFKTIHIYIKKKSLKHLSEKYQILIVREGHWECTENLLKYSNVSIILCGGEEASLVVLKTDVFFRASKKMFFIIHSWQKKKNFSLKEFQKIFKKLKNSPYSSKKMKTWKWKIVFKPMSV